MNISPAIQPGEYMATHGLILGHSAFNPVWISELGVSDPKVIFDIGGYDAGDAIRFKQLFRSAEVYCFEPDCIRADRIKKYATSFKIIFHPIAIYDKTGQDYFYPSICNSKDAGSTHHPGERAGQGSFLKHNEIYKQNYPQINQQTPELVSCITLSDYCQFNQIKQVDLVHIDAEGGEYAVVKGFGMVRPKIVYVETLNNMFENCHSVNDLHDLLTSMNYVLVKDFISDRLYKHEP